jgi:hypothetical protein
MTTTPNLIKVTTKPVLTTAQELQQAAAGSGSQIVKTATNPNGIVVVF